jgi:hypothetical protein
MPEKKLKFRFGKRRVSLDVDQSLWDDLPPEAHALLKDPELFQEYSRVCRERYEQAEKSLAEPKPVSCQSRPIRKDVRRFRIWSSRLAVIGLLYSLVDCFLPVGNPIVSILAVGFGLSVLLAMMAEVLLGAGLEVQTELLQGETFSRTTRFLPSIRGVPQVACLLSLGMGSITLGFASLHAAVSRSWMGSYSKELSGIEAIYFAVVTFATVGYGDVVPIWAIAKIAVVGQILVSWAAIAIALTALIPWSLSFMQKEQERLQKEREDTVQRREKILRVAKLGLYSDDATESEIREEATRRLDLRSRGQQ